MEYVRNALTYRRNRDGIIELISTKDIIEIYIHIACKLSCLCIISEVHITNTLSVSVIKEILNHILRTCISSTEIVINRYFVEMESLILSILFLCCRSCLCYITLFISCSLCSLISLLLLTYLRNNLFHNIKCHTCNSHILYIEVLKVGQIHNLIGC